MWESILKKNDRKLLERLLTEKGYELVKVEQGGKHPRLTIKELSSGRTETFPAATSAVSGKKRLGARGLRNYVSQVTAKFKGRARRGQGQFKLSENDNEEHWTDILKAPHLGTEDRERKKNFIKQGKIILSMPFRREGMPHDAEYPDKENAKNLFNHMKRNGETEFYSYDAALKYMEQLQEGTAVEFGLEDFKAYGPHPSDWEFKVKVL